MTDPAARQLNLKPTGHASRGVFEDGALAALLIILAGLYPAFVLAKTGTDRAG